MYSRSKGRGFPSVGGEHGSAAAGGRHSRRVAYSAGGGRRPRWIRTSQFTGLVLQFSVSLFCLLSHLRQ